VYRWSITRGVAHAVKRWLALSLGRNVLAISEKCRKSVLFAMSGHIRSLTLQVTILSHTGAEGLFTKRAWLVARLVEDHLGWLLAKTLIRAAILKNIRDPTGTYWWVL
jgi:hypothetical protein